MPPPAAPDWTAASFQTDSRGAGLTAARLVPPTPVTNGCEDGSSTARAVLLFWGSQSSEPLSPVAARTVWPWTAACWNTVLSALAAAAPWRASHMPQLVVITWAVSLLTMVL